MAKYADMSGYTPEEFALWDELIRVQNETFYTAKGLPFSFLIRGNEMFVTRKNKSITRAAVNRAFRLAREEMRVRGFVKGPKRMDVFGSSYLYPIFLRIGIITSTPQK